MRFSVTIGKNPPAFTRLIEPLSYGFYINRVYVCPQCGDAWARWQNEPVTLDEAPMQFSAFHATCPDHTYGWWEGDNPGSLINAKEDIIILPRELLIRELMLLMPATETADEISENTIEGNS